jgi:hypothetical protein
MKKVLILITFIIISVVSAEAQNLSFKKSSINTEVRNDTTAGDYLQRASNNMLASKLVYLLGTGMSALFMVKTQDVNGSLFILGTVVATVTIIDFIVMDKINKAGIRLKKENQTNH